MTEERGSSDRRLVFVGGVHRSGTTPLTRWIGHHPDVSAFEDTGAFEDEGQHLQDVYLTSGDHGGQGRFAFDPAAHLTEESDLVSSESRDRLWRSWSRHWDTSRRALIEKSPPNLIRTRFLQALFAPSETYFVIVMRHPIAVSYATKKGRRDIQIPSLIDHWLTGYETFLADAPRLRNVLVVRYEELVTDPGAELAKVFDFLGLDPHSESWPVSTSLNARYVSRWRGSRAVGYIPLKKTLYLRRIERRFESRLAPYGYSLAEPERLDPMAPEIARYAGAGGRSAGSSPES